MISPRDLGLPLDRWRPRQYDAVWDIVQADPRTVGLVAPTGFGKSPVYVGAALMAGYRTAFLTATKGLQDQLTDPVRGLVDAGLLDIRGRNNYVCLLDQGDRHRWAKRTHPLMVDEGICNFGAPCDLKADGCTYFDTYRLALKSQLVVTNYSYWLASHAYGDGLGRFDLIVCDEAHSAADQLGDFLSVSLQWREMGDYGIEDPPADADSWADWAAPHAIALTKQAQDMEEGLGFYTARTQLREIKHVKELARRMLAIADMQGEWVLDKTDRGFRWDPVWARPYAEEYLFRRIPHVLLVSATIRPKTLGILGLDGRPSSFLEYPSSFPVPRRPIYVLPSVRLNNTSSPYHLQQWVRTIDGILGSRLDRKGYIDTHSYQRRDYLVANSKHRHRMVVHSRDNTAAVVEKFKSDPTPGRFLVSPSCGTGYDFPYKECEFVIISKVPYPNLGSKVVEARRKGDKDYMAYEAAQKIVQISGRGMRAADDRCEIFIVDENVKNIFRTHRNFFPRWWLDAVRFVKETPPPAPKL